jgi:hypothetical protein
MITGFQVGVADRPQALMSKRKRGDLDKEKRRTTVALLGEFAADAGSAAVCASGPAVLATVHPMLRTISRSSQNVSALTEDKLATPKTTRNVSMCHTRTTLIDADNVTHLTSSNVIAETSVALNLLRLSVPKT